jgi:diguanylate cyclase (GGDEF)-like protein
MNVSGVLYPVIIDCICAFSIGITLFLAKRNPLSIANKSPYYILTASLILTDVVLDAIALVFQPTNNPTVIVLCWIVNSLGFFFMPMAAYAFCLLRHRKVAQHMKLLIIPCLLNGIVLIFNGFFNFIFYIDANDDYHRGPAFFMELGILLIYVLVMLLAEISYLKNNKVEKDDAFLILLIYFLVVFGGLFQSIYPACLSIWPSVSISIVLYYLFLREQEMKLDKLTGTYNRASFIKVMDRMNKNTEDQSIAIGVFDINRFKSINDICGHIQGDETLKKTAEMLSEAFAGSGFVFRTGGDEFCFIGRDVNPEQFNQAQQKLMDLSKDYIIDGKFHYQLARGFVYKEAGKAEDMYVIYSRADKLMYKDKALGED